MSGQRPVKAGPWLSLLAFVLVLIVDFGLAQAARRPTDADPEDAAFDGAASAYGVITVDLRPELGAVPTKICVVSEAQGPRTRQTLSELLGQEGAPPRGDGEDSTAEGSSDQKWFTLAEAGTGEDDSACTYDGRCVPRVRLPRGQIDASQLYMACVSDSLGGDGSGRGRPQTAVVMLEHLGGSPPSIGSLRLAGGIATIGVHLDVRRVVVTARSLGGDYAPHDRSYRAEISGLDNKLVNLPLSPLCRWVKMRLDGARFREGDARRVQLSLDGRAVGNRKCRVPRTGKTALRVLLPRSEGGGRLDVSFADAGGRSRPIQKHSVRWDGRWPEEGDRLEATEITFLWRRPDCIYPRNQCPTAELEGGIRCTAHSGEDGRYCEYSCSSGRGLGEGRTISTPVTVAFEKREPTQRWSEALQRPGQILSSYVDRERIYLRGDVSDWRTDQPGNRITHVEFVQSDGQSRRYPVSDREKITILAPEASCEALPFNIIGDRSHRQASARVIDGRVVFDPPEASADILTYHISLTGGMAFSLLRRTREHGGGRPEFLEAPRSFSATFLIGINLRSRLAALARLSWDLRVGFIWGMSGHFEGQEQVDPRSNAARPLDARYRWGRLVAGGAIVMDLFPMLSAGVGIDLGASFPLETLDQALAGAGFGFIASPTIDVRFSVRRWLFLTFEGRSILGEKIFRYTLLNADSDQDNIAMHSFPILFSAGFRGVF